MNSELDGERLPTRLREAVRRDFALVAPLAPPWRRAGGLALPTLGLLAATLLLLARRDDSSAPTSSIGGDLALGEWIAGLALAWLALREAVPGLGAGTARALVALAGGVALQVGLAVLLWGRTEADLSGPSALAAGLRCATIVAAIGLPHLALAVWLARRAMPLRPRISGALAGAAAGLLADAVWNLACTRNDLEHLTVWHVGTTATLALAGAIAGAFGRRPRGGER